MLGQKRMTRASRQRPDIEGIRLEKDQNDRKRPDCNPDMDEVFRVGSKKIQAGRHGSRDMAGMPNPLSSTPGTRTS